MDMLILIFAAILGLIPAAIAQSKGRQFGLWWLYGFLLFLVALIHSLLMKPDEKYLEAQALASGESKKCPKCAELIKAEAKMCRYCGHEMRVKKPVSDEMPLGFYNPHAEDDVPEEFRG